MALRHGIDFGKAQALHQQELALFSERRPRSRQLSAAGGEHLLFGAPLHWMADWFPFNLYVEEAGARGCATWTAMNTWTFAWATPARCSAIRRRRWRAR